MSSSGKMDIKTFSVYIMVSQSFYIFFLYQSKFSFLILIKSFTAFLGQKCLTQIQGNLSFPLVVIYSATWAIFKPKLKKIKKSTLKKIRKWNFLAPKNLIKEKLGAWMLQQLLLFTGCSSIRFFNSFFVTYETSCRATDHHSDLSFCDLRDGMPCQRSLLSSRTTFVTNGTP